VNFDAHAAQYRERGRALHGERRDVRSFVDDAHVEPDRRIHQPCTVTLLRTQPVLAVSQMEDRPVVDNLSLVVTPHGVGHAARPDLAHVASYETVDIHERIRPGDAVLGHR
jgi:hypothetical protein